VERRDDGKIFRRLDSASEAILSPSASCTQARLAPVANPPQSLHTFSTQPPRPFSQLIRHCTLDLHAALVATCPDPPAFRRIVQRSFLLTCRLLTWARSSTRRGQRCGENHSHWSRQNQLSLPTQWSVFNYVLRCAQAWPLGVARQGYKLATVSCISSKTLLRSSLPSCQSPISSYSLVCRYYVAIHTCHYEG